MNSSYKKLANYNSSSTNLCSDGKVWRQCGGINGKQVCVSENEDWTNYCDNVHNIGCFPNEVVKTCPNTQKQICIGKGEDLVKKCNEYCNM